MPEPLTRAQALRKQWTPVVVPETTTYEQGGARMNIPAAAVDEINDALCDAHSLIRVVEAVNFDAYDVGDAISVTLFIASRLIGEARAAIRSAKPPAAG